MANERTIKTEDAKYSILDRAVNIEPSGVIYNIKGSDIENFIEEYLAQKHVDGVSEVKVRVRSEGKSRPEVALYLFMDQNSKMISSEMQNVPPMLRNKVETKVNMKINEDFRRILTPLCGNEIISGKAENREYYVKLNIFYAIGIMFSANRRQHDLVIADARIIPGGRDSLISVIKSEIFVGTGGNGGDRHLRQIDYLEKRHDN